MPVQSAEFLRLQAGRYDIGGFHIVVLVGTGIVDTAHGKTTQSLLDHFFMLLNILTYAGFMVLGYFVYYIDVYLGCVQSMCTWLCCRLHACLSCMPPSWFSPYRLSHLGRDPHALECYVPVLLLRSFCSTSL